MHKSIKLVISFSMLFFSLICFIWFLLVPSYHNSILFAVCFAWIGGICYACSDFKRHCIFFFFELAFFFFLLGRPLIDFVEGRDWVLFQKRNYYFNADAIKAMAIIYCALVCTLLGVFLGEVLNHKKNTKQTGHYPVKTAYISNVRLISFTIFVLSFFASLAVGIEKIMFIQSHSYADYYILYRSQLPYFLRVVSSFLGYSAFAYLTTLPSKKHTVRVLFLYIFTALPDLLMGRRSEIVYMLVFCLVYFLLRDYFSKTNFWIGKREKIALIIGIPVLLIFLGAYNYIREGLSPNLGIFGIIKDFTYKQGVTFSWFSSGLGAMDRLPNIANPHYTFGPIADYFQDSTLGQIVFGTHSLGAGNTVLRATMGNSMAHHLSYIIIGDRYLAGHGTGSSYLLELFVDYGYAGVVVASILIGFLTVKSTEFSKHNLFALYFTLNVLISFFSIPRASTIEPLMFLCKIPFWLVFVLCFGVARVSDKVSLCYVKKRYTFHFG